MRRVPLLALVVASTGAARPGQVVRVEQVGHPEVHIPAGTFTMGLDDNAIAEVGAECEVAFPTAKGTRGSTPSGLGLLCDAYQRAMTHMSARRVFTSAYWIDRDEVSVTDYRACIHAGACDLDATVAGDERYIQDSWPMVNVTWDEAQRFCKWRGGRLPTEAEWERAARGDSKGPWPWGATARPNDFNHGKAVSGVTYDITRASPIQASIDSPGEADDSDGADILAPPGTYPWGEGPYGTRDQAGNVAEWTADAYLLPNSALDDSPQGYDGLASADPLRTGSPGDARIVRGGSWRQPAFLSRVNVRDPLYELINLGLAIYQPDHRYPFVGFRCVRPG